MVNAVGAHQRSPGPGDVVAGAPRDRVVLAVAVRILVAERLQQPFELVEGEVLVQIEDTAQRVDLHRLIQVRHREADVLGPVATEGGEGQQGVGVLTDVVQRHVLGRVVGTASQQPADRVQVVEQLGVLGCMLVQHLHRDRAGEPLRQTIERVDGAEQVRALARGQQQTHLFGVAVVDAVGDDADVEPLLHLVEEPSRLLARADLHQERDLHRSVGSRPGRCLPCRTRKEGCEGEQPDEGGEAKSCLFHGVRHLR